MKFFFAALVLALALSTTTADDKLQFQFYYESMCPGCYAYLTIAWKTALYIPGLDTLFTLNLYPYGNASEKQVGEQWEFTCQHGEAECEGNIMEVCIQDELDNITANKAIIYLEDQWQYNISWDESLEACASKFQFSTENIYSCMQSSHGNQLQHQVAVSTDNLNPPHKWVPWLVFNGEYSEEVQDEVYNDPVRFICQNYSGPASVIQAVSVCDNYTQVKNTRQSRSQFCYVQSALEYLMN